MSRSMPLKVMITHGIQFVFITNIPASICRVLLLYSTFRLMFEVGDGTAWVNIFVARVPDLVNY